MRHGGGHRQGFSLIEAVLALVLLLMMGVLATGFYATGADNARQQSDELRISMLLRDQLEALLATRPASLASGSRVVSVNGRSSTMSWDIQPLDLDGDGVVEANARRIAVTLADRTLATIVVDAQGYVGKI